MEAEQDTRRPTQIPPHKILLRKIYERIAFVRPEFDDFILKASPGSRVLDVGCGTGLTLDVALHYRKDLELYAIDVVERIPEFLSAVVKFKRVDLELESLPFESDWFDLVVCSHVIEHLTAPFNLFREVHRVLKRGGYALFETPSPRGLFVPRAFPLWFRDSPTLNFYDDPTHIRPYSRASLVKLGRKAGFASIECKKARNIISIASFPLALLDGLRRRGGSLSGLVKNLLGTANLLIVSK